VAGYFVITIFIGKVYTMKSFLSKALFLSSLSMVLFCSCAPEEKVVTGPAEEPKVIEVKAIETKPVETKPVETKPVETKPVTVEEKPKERLWKSPLSRQILLRK
jgi:hypothetical protein